jgi:hypothetical protein
MRSVRRQIRSIRSVSVALLLIAAGVMLVPGGASAGGCQSWGSQPLSVAGSDTLLLDVSVVSTCTAWVVGESDSPGPVATTLVERWNGTSWKIQSSPSPQNQASLSGVAATSARNAWAVGASFDTRSNTLVERWNGASWQVVPAPDPGTSARLTSVAAVSTSRAWAVGQRVAGGVARTLIERWNGVAWKVQSSPNPGPTGSNQILNAVAATSTTNAWAVGYRSKGVLAGLVILHWDGAAWKAQATPHPADPVVLTDVTATSPTNAWAVGYRSHGAEDFTYVLHWNGLSWKVQSTPNVGGSTLSGIWSTSGSNAWAAGAGTRAGHSVTLLLRWNGTTWKVQSTPNPGDTANTLSAVAASSPTNAWAVGSSIDQGVRKAIAVHCC